MARAPEISVVVCTYNRAGLLRKCIESILKQTLGREHYEILIVDNGSTDSTERVISNYSGEPLLRAVTEPVRGLSRARNTGWQSARGTYVGYIDDDATASRIWLEAALSSFREVKPAPEWVGGPIDLEWEANAPTWLEGDLLPSLGRVFLGTEPRWLSPQEWLGGGNSFYGKALLKMVNGFDECLGRGASGLLSGEETELQQRMQARGLRLFYNPAAAIRHFVPSERCRPGWFYRRYYWGGVTDAIMARVLAEKSVARQVHGNDADGGDLARSRLTRFAGHLRFATGLGPDDRTIKSRIYMAYVLGRIAGHIGLHNKRGS